MRPTNHLRTTVFGLLAVASTLAVAFPALAAGGRPNLLVHGNYCGPGNNGPGAPPVDALDAACARHDACTPGVGLPGCGCNDRLRRESAAIAGDPRQPRDLRSLAGIVSFGAGLLACTPSRGSAGYAYPPFVSPSYPGDGEPGEDVTVPYDPFHG